MMLGGTALVFLSSNCGAALTTPRGRDQSWTLRIAAARFGRMGMLGKLRHVKADVLLLGEDSRMPNSDKPVLLYRRVAKGDGLEPLFYATFKANDWGGIWSNGIFGYHHFHSNAHEVLGIAAGTATLVLGGQSGRHLEVSAGDVLVLPAGTGHRRVKHSADFLVVGAYPAGQEQPDEYVDKHLCANFRNRLRAVRTPDRDPLFGNDGSLTQHW